MSTIKIFKPCSPSTNISVKELKGVAITVSWGGGIGGISKTIYAKKISTKDGIVVATSVNGEVIKINKTFIVMEKDIKLIEVVTDVTAHRNFSNPNAVKSSILTQYFSINKNDEYLFNGSDYGQSPEVIYQFSKVS